MDWWSDNLITGLNLKPALKIHVLHNLPLEEGYTKNSCYFGRHMRVHCDIAAL